MFQKKCATCQLYLPQHRTCQIMMPLMQGKIGPEDHCSQHNDHLAVCENCGAVLLESFVEVKEDGAHVYCERCITME